VRGDASRFSEDHGDHRASERGGGGAPIDVRARATEPSARRPEKAPPPARLLLPLADLEISTRTLKRLEDAGIMTLLELVQRTEMDLVKIKGWNRAALQEVKGLLAGMNLSLGMRV
jgi:DNA-directed RNA polymerase subunit alpha